MTAAMARVVEHSPRTRTGSGAGSSLPRALSGVGFRGIIRNRKIFVKNRDGTERHCLLTSRPLSRAFGGGL